jgi:hypothetical protein
MGLGARKWFLENWEIILREIAYHKEHRAMESLPYKVVEKVESE